jgi:hypothetical protein
MLNKNNVSALKVIRNLETKILDTGMVAPVTRNAYRTGVLRP